jgi:hypothetical protein
MSSWLRRIRNFAAIALLVSVTATIAVTRASSATPQLVFKAYQSASAATQSTTGGAQIPVTLDIESFDPGDDFNTTTSTYKVPESGYYHFDGRVGVNLMAGHRVFASIFANNVEISRGSDFFLNQTGVSGNLVSDTVKLKQGDKIQLRIWDGADGDTIDKGFTYITYLAGYRVRA